MAKPYFFKRTEDSLIFPNEYIVAESYECLPNVREELADGTYRDDNTRRLHRQTVIGATTIKFDVIDDLTLAEKQEIQAFFTDKETNATERKIHLTYWDDETNVYKTDYFYRPDITYVTKKLTDTDRIYKGFTINLIGYKEG